MPPLLKHIRQQAPGNTLVPLELLVQSLHEAGVSNNAVQFSPGKHPLEATNDNAATLEAKILEKLALEPPSNVAALRAALDSSKIVSKLLM